MNSQLNNRTSYDDLEEEDLDLDLGIENETVSSIRVQTKVKEASENLFKKPAEPLKAKNKNTIDDLIDDSILNSLIEEDAQAAPISNPKYQENLDVLSQLFENDEDDNDDDDMQTFFKNESVIVSTQKVVCSSSKQTNYASKTTKPQEKLDPPKPVSEPIVTQKAKEPIKQNPPQKPNDSIIIEKEKPSDTSVIVEKVTNRSRTISNETELKSSKEVLIALKENKMWNVAKDDLKINFQNAKLELPTIHDYNIQYYFKKFFEKDLLIKYDQSLKMRKLPILCAWIKEISFKLNQATVVLNDDGPDEICGNIPKSILEENMPYFMIGSVLLLQDVFLLRVDYGKDCYHLHVKKENLLSIYYLNLEGAITDNEVAKKEFKELNVNKIKELIDKFEELYTNYDYLSYIANNTTLNNTTTNSSMNKSKSNDQSTFKKKSNSLSNLNAKPAPYQVPNRGGGQVQPQAQAQFNKPKPPTLPTLPSIQAPSSSTSQRNFNFKPTQSNKPLDPPQFNSTFSSSQAPALTQEALSQLIFGIEDQLFEED